MAVITPQTDVYLLKVPLEIDDNNQLTFENATAQYNYFNSLPKLEVTDFTYQRKDNTIRYGANYDSLITYNYVMYRNDAYSDKWFYAFITGMEYLNDNVTAISIKEDCWQTWQFDLNFKPVLIDREHTNDDTIGKNTLPEELELGEMVANGSTVNFGGVGGIAQSEYRVVVEVSQVENEGESATLSYSWSDGGTYSTTPTLNCINRGTIPLVLPRNYNASMATRLYDYAGLGDSIINVYMIPEQLIGTTHRIVLTASRDGTSISEAFDVPYMSFDTYDIGTSTFHRPGNVDNYVPNNNKLFTYPYCYFNISNNAGTSQPYRYEDFTNVIRFKVEGTFGLSGSTKAIPQDYLRISSSDNALDYSVTGPKYPVCSWKSDSYTNWLTQNAVNMETQWKSAIVGGALGIATGGFSSGMQGKATEIGFAKGFGAGALVAGAEMAGNLIQVAREQHLAKTQANLVSDQVKGNLGAGDFVWAKYRSPFTFTPMSIKAEYARCIDEFFTQFGYKCNRVKRPNITGRRNWNYVKTVGCYIEANIPQSSLAEIKNMFDRGITLWHNPINFGNYGADNDII